MARRPVARPAPDTTRQRKFSWYWHGDPLTPGAPATRDAERLDPRTAPRLPSIPVIPISASEAKKIDRGARVRMSVEMDDGPRTIRNVVATIRGGEEPDRWILFGTHHDASTLALRPRRSWRSPIAYSR